MHLRLLLCALISLSLVQASHAATYYLNPVSGVNSNTGTSPGTAWRTINKVATPGSGVGPDDIINIVGGSYTRSQLVDDGTYYVWGASGNKGTAGHPITIQAQPGQTVTIDGQQGSLWINFAPASDTGYYVVIKDLRFSNYAGNTISVGGPAYGHHVAVLNCRFTNFSHWQSAPLGTGTAHHVIFQGNYINNIGDPALGGDAFPESEHAFYLSHDSSWVVLDGNYAEKISGWGFHFYGGADLSTTSRNNIVRRNTVVNAAEAGLILSATNYLNTYIYHNTFYGDAVPFPALKSTSAQAIVHSILGGTSLVTSVLKNNIGYGHATSGAMASTDNARWNSSLTLNYNLWQNLADTSAPYYWDGAAKTLSLFRSTYGYSANDLQGNPLFTNIGTRDFTLQDPSPAIDTGTFLTTTTGSGSGTSLTVVDAGYFHDGYGLIDGDTIQLQGQTATAIINSISGNTLTLRTALPPWSSGVGVALPYNGSAPDMGAFESGSAVVGPPPAPFNLRLVGAGRP